MMYHIWTDGGCDKNPGGKGGWAFVLLKDSEKVSESSGGFDSTTNNRMELMAIIKGLEAVEPNPDKKTTKIRFYSDSKYVVNGFNKWSIAWKAKGWKKSGGEIKNLDLWKRLDALRSKFEVVGKWVRGHSGYEHNERCDVLCTQEILKSPSTIDEGYQPPPESSKPNKKTKKDDWMDGFLCAVATVIRLEGHGDQTAQELLDCIVMPVKSEISPIDLKVFEEYGVFKMLEERNPESYKGKFNE